MVDFENTLLAEPAFFFVQDPDVFADFCLRSETEELSIMEYIALYKRAEFEEWLRLKHPQLFNICNCIGS